MADPKVEELYALIEQWTRAEIMARFGQVGGSGDICYAHLQVEIKDKIRKLVHGTDDLVVLGARWGILKDLHKQAEEAAKEKLERRAQKLREELAAMDDGD